MAIFSLISFFPSLVKGNLPLQSLSLKEGEIYNLSVPQLEKFSVGNGEVVAVKFLKLKKLLVIRAKKSGASDLVIWEKNENSTRFKITVLKENSGVPVLLPGPSLEGFLKHYGVEFKKSGHGLIQAILKTSADWQNVCPLRKKFLDLHLVLSSDLKQKILQQVLEVFYKEEFDFVLCHPTFPSLLCSLPKNEEKRATILLGLLEQWCVSLIFREEELKNYVFEISIGEIIKKQEKKWDVIDSFKKAAFSWEKIPWKELDFFGRSFWHEKITLTPYIQSSLALKGQGLGNSFLTLELIPQGKKFLLKYKWNNLLQKDTLDSAPASQVSLSIGVPLTLFEIEGNQVILQQQRLPFFSDFPVLGDLFDSSYPMEEKRTLLGLGILQESSSWP